MINIINLHNKKFNEIQVREAHIHTPHIKAHPNHTAETSDEDGDTLKAVGGQNYVQRNVEKIQTCYKHCRSGDNGRISLTC